MRKLSKSAYKEIRTWIYRNARPLELALWQFCFEGGTREQVMETYEILKKNQYGKYLKDVLDGKYVDKIHPQDF